MSLFNNGTGLGALAGLALSQNGNVLQSTATGALIGTLAHNFAANRNRLAGGVRRSKRIAAIHKKRGSPVYYGSPKRSPKLIGGWMTVPKSDPRLWEEVLDEVKKQNPGPWAAWKAEKAIKVYKERGGRYNEAR